MKLKKGDSVVIQGQVGTVTFARNFKRGGWKAIDFTFKLDKRDRQIQQRQNEKETKRQKADFKKYLKGLTKQFSARLKRGQSAGSNGSTPTRRPRACK